MFIILLKFSDNKAQASAFMTGHNAWLRGGFEDGVFLVAGSLQTSAGGVILAHNCSLADLDNMVKTDPFVANDVVSAEIIEFSPSRTGERLKFLIG